MAQVPPLGIAGSHKTHRHGIAVEELPLMLPSPFPPEGVVQLLS